MKCQKENKTKRKRKKEKERKVNIYVWGNLRPTHQTKMKG
jgi:hypothetical protein